MMISGQVLVDTYLVHVPTVPEKQWPTADIAVGESKSMICGVQLGCNFEECIKSRGLFVIVLNAFVQ